MRILDAAAQRLREQGLDGAAIAPVMREAGLTHGAFYAHFETKSELTNTAFAHALATRRPQWIGPEKSKPWRARLRGLAERYLSTAHRDDPGTGCAFAATASEAAHANEDFRNRFEQELRTSLAAICDDTDENQLDDAIALMAICVGGLSLARAVPDDEFSARILRVARQAAAAVADASTTQEDQ